VTELISVAAAAACLVAVSTLASHVWGHGFGGLAALVTFCALIGLLVERAGVTPAFLLATAAALLVQAGAARLHAPLPAAGAPLPARAG